MTTTIKNPIWTARELERVTSGSTSGDWSISGITFDSRHIRPGDAFIALKNKDFHNIAGGSIGTDGHAFIDDALSNGAHAVIASDVPKHLENDPRILKVSSTYQALMDMGYGSRARSHAKTIGITGSVGKTSTRDILAMILSSFGQTHQTQKSFNNILGVPITLANQPASCDYSVVEMGMNQTGEITPLTKMTKPDIAVITSIAPAHLANFQDGMKGIVKAKAEIFAGLNEHGIIIIPRDSEYYADLLGLARMSCAKQILSFGEHPESDARITSCLEARNGTQISADIKGKKVTYFMPAGKHMALNALCALLTAEALGLDLTRAAQVLASFTPLSGRGREERINIGDPENPVILLDESYNASPASMDAAFRVVALIDPGRGGRRIAILGDMRELGADGPKLHADLALPIRAANIDLVYTCGPLMKNLHDSLPANQRGRHTETSTEMAQIVPEVLVPGDVIVVKGSHGSRMDVVVEALRALPSQKDRQKDKGQQQHAL